MKLRQGRRVPENCYLQVGPEPDNGVDEALFTIHRRPDLTALIVAAVNLAEAELAYASTASKELDRLVTVSADLATARDLYRTASEAVVVR